MSNIYIGNTVKGRKIEINLDVLIRTRLLIQANSGGGKSYLIRRIAEQAFGKIPIIIIDPEGEFSTLREKYDFVLVGKGGETPADIRSAGLLAHKLLELNASAVCDLYEMKASERHEWVKRFLDSLLDAPKKLWRPVLVIVDEAHVYAPEKGAGDSIASDSMIALATRGRKRGFCAIFATQRLGKLRKDAAAELTNVLIGQTFIDIDRKRAAEMLGIPRSDEAKFFDEMKVIEPGNFHALGRAITKERVLVKIGTVTTTHPEPGDTFLSVEPPPPSSKIKAMLPKLSELPQVAEQKARTESELRREIAELQRQLTARPQIEVPKPEIKIEQVPVLKDEEIERMEAIAKSFGDTASQLATAGRDILSALQRQRNKPAPIIHTLHSTPRQNDNPSQQANGLSGPEQRILNAIAWFESIGQYNPKQVGVAFMAGYTFGGGAFNNPRSSLRTKGLVEYSGNQINMTDAGRQIAAYPQVPFTVDEMQAHVMKALPGPERKILSVLIENYRNPISKETLAEASGYRLGGAFNNPLSRLRSLGLAEYPEKNKVVAASVLFLE